MTSQRESAVHEGSAGERRGAHAGRRWLAQPGGAMSWEAMRFCVAAFVVVRLGLFVVGLLSVAVLPANSPAGVPGWAPPEVAHNWSVMFTAWERWDALWYLRIADQGYAPADGSAAFFPGYPLLVRVVGWLLGGHLLVGAYVVSSVAMVAALIVVYQLTELEFDRDLARRTVLLLCVFPTSFFFFAPYSEALFLAFAAGALLAARRSAWGTAVVLAAAATATRNTGVFVSLAVSVECLRQGLVNRPRGKVLAMSLGRSVLVGIGSLAGVAAYLGWWWHTGGSPRIPFRAEGGWQRHLELPWVTLYDGVHEGLRWIGVYSGGYQLVDLIVVAIVFAAGVWVVMRLPLAYRVYTAVSLVAPLCLAFGGRPFMSMPRFAIVVFPLFWALALFARRFRAWEATVATSAVGLGMLSLLFVNWYWVF